MRELEQELRAFDPQVRPPAMPDTDVSYVVADAPVGRLVLAATAAGLVVCTYDAEDEALARLARRVSPRILRSARRLDPVRRELDAYFAGGLRRFGARVDLGLASAFTRTVLDALASVPYGETTTYAALARSIGRPDAARAVGHALGANPVCIVVPCHRVVRSDGTSGGYAGGAAAKEMLLELERR